MILFLPYKSLALYTKSTKSHIKVNFAIIPLLHKEIPSLLQLFFMRLP